MADFRGYVTAAGQTFEALAKQMGYPVTIGFIEVGDGKLPDSESPIARTQLVHKLKQFPAIVEQDAKNPGQWVATCYIPADDAINGAGYFIREIGCKLINQGAGVLYAYRRVSDDWKPVITSGEAKSFIYKLRFIPSNGELLTPTIDPSVVLVDKEELARVMAAHVESRDHPYSTELQPGFLRQVSNDEITEEESDEGALDPAVTKSKLWFWLRKVLSSAGGERFVSGYNCIEDMVSDIRLSRGNKVSTGGSRWEIVDHETPLALKNGTYARLIGKLFIGDFIGDEVAKLNEYITYGISESYQSRADAESYKYALKPLTVVFDKLVLSDSPLLLMHHVKYERHGAGMYFNRKMNAGVHYSPDNINSCATEPVVFELTNGVFLRKKGSLIGTPDNPVGGDSDYITMSDGCDFSIDITTRKGVKLGFNFCCCPGITGERPSIGIAEQAGDEISAPRVAMMVSKSWSHRINKPMLRSSQQSIVAVGANGGGVICQPYCQRDGTFIDDIVPYTTDAIIAAGKGGSSGISFLSSRDVTVDNPIIENFKFPIVSSNSESLVVKPHIEGITVENSIVVEDAYLDIDGWATVWPTATGPLVYSVAQDGSDRMVILRGMPMTLGPVNGLVGGNYTRAFLIIEDASGAVTDYAKMGDWHAVRRFDLSISRSIFVDAVNGSDSNMGLTSSKPVKNMSVAIKILNTINRMSPAQSIVDISLKSDVVVDVVTRALKPFALWGAFKLSSKQSGYIELFDCGSIQVRQPEIIGVSSAVFRHVGGSISMVCDSIKASGVAICQTTWPGDIHLTIKGGDVSGLAKYVDGSGESSVTLVVNSSVRNASIDSNPTGEKQLVVAKRITPAL